MHMDGSPFLSIKFGKPIKWKHSHNRLPLGIAEQALAEGHSVYVVGGSFTNPTHVEKLFPVAIVGKSIPISSKQLNGAINICLYTWQMDGIRKINPSFKVAWALSACYWLEDPDFSSAAWFGEFSNVVKNDLDFVITQSDIMKQQVLAITDLLNARHLRDRFLIAWSNPEKDDIYELRHDPRQVSTLRKELGVSNDDVVILNAGGAWDWTDIETFLESFRLWFEHNPDSKLMFVQLGIRQKGNVDHSITASYIDRYIKANSDLVERGRLRIISDWNQATSMVDSYLKIADIGLNVNKNSLEGFQSVRQRFLDYLSSGLPVMNTLGDQAMYQPLSSACLFVTPGDVGSYREAFRKLESETALFPNMNDARALLLKNTDYSGVTEVLTTTELTPPNPPELSRTVEKLPVLNSSLSEKTMREFSEILNLLLPRLAVILLRKLLESVQLLAKRP
jgi:hypothetical protein